MTAIDRAERFLRRVWGKANAGYLCIFTKPGFASKFFSLDDPNGIHKAALYSIEMTRARNVFFVVGLLKTPPNKGRGTEERVVGIPGLWLDIDIQGTGHKKEKLPRSESDAVKLLEAVPIEPTLIVRTGGGLHAYWLFDEPWFFSSKAEREKAKDLSNRFQAHLRKHAREEYGWDIDKTAALNQPLRVSGTLNRKDSSNIKPVRYEVVGGKIQWYDVADIEAILPKPVAKQAASDRGKNRTTSPPKDEEWDWDGPPAELSSILKGSGLTRHLGGCGWMDHVTRNAGPHLNNRERFAMLTILVRCEEGERLAHQVNEACPGYQHSEMQATLDHIKAGSH